MKRKIVKAISNLPGWSTKRKIIVIESDDWGSIRMPSTKTRKFLENHNVNLNKGLESYRYSLFDTLCSEEDLDALFSTLQKFKDSNNRHPVITALSLCSNPDFKKIESDNFNSYYYESIKDTFLKYNRGQVINIWNEGQQNCLFFPEFHGREHLNVPAWMRLLRSGNKQIKIAFNEEMWAITIPGQVVDLQAAFDLEFASDFESHKNVINSGLKIFETLFNRKALYFVPPNGPFNNELFEEAKNRGVNLVSSAKIQREVFGEGRTKLRFHWLGKNNSYNQTTITRNCIFEPSDTSKDWISLCLRDIASAFKYKKPAIISSHRVNYIGGLCERNRKKGLQDLSNLLAKILKTWPEVEFMTSVELGNAIKRI